MALYLDQFSIVDTDTIVLAHPVEGVGPSDGHYAISYLFEVGGKKVREMVEYPDQRTRDAGFAALCEVLRKEEAEAQRLREVYTLRQDLDEGEALP